MNESEFIVRYGSYLKKHQGEFWTYKEVVKFAEKEKIKEVDFDLLMVFAKNGLFNGFYSARPSVNIQRGWKLLQIDSYKHLLEEYGLSNLENNFNVICSYFLSYHSYASKIDIHKKNVAVLLKEHKFLVELLRDNGIDGIKSISFKPKRSKALTIKSNKLINFISKQLIKNLKLEEDILDKAFNIEIGKKGKPLSKKKEVLEIATTCICEYLDFKNQLMPNNNHKVSDQRRKFIGQLFENLNILPTDVVIPKEYINTLLNKYQVF